jgi:SAM-dependent methyltransferase
MARCERDFQSAISAVDGLRVLDLGCGTGKQAFALLSKGAQVDGIDISDKYIDSARQEAVAMGLDESRWSFQAMDAHALRFGERTFDLVVGRGILHHLDLHTAVAEIRRVLKPGGRALFLEPLGANPLLKVFRLMTPNARTEDECPLTSEDLAAMSRLWRTESTYYGVLSAPIAVMTSILLRPYPNNYLLRLADVCERKLNKLRAIQPLNQYVLLNLVRV